jgi:signal transduction histidine kinase
MSIYAKDYGDFLSLPGIEIKSLLIVPVTSKGAQIGVLNVVNKKFGVFAQLDQEILVSFTDQAANFIDNSYRFLQSDIVTELVHELRTPLASLNTALYLLQRSDLSDERREQISQMIHTEFNRLSELTTSFLDYAYLKSGRAKFKPTQFDLTQLINESVDIVQMQLDGKGLTISLDTPTEPLLITADKDKIKQVIINLLSNAMKYNYPGGYIKITSNVTSVDISFSIQDNGQGIPPEYLPRLFERFYRVPTTERQIQGSGLGLSISKHIVEAHNGKIVVSSTLGQGSTFTVHLPINQEV